MRASAFWWDLSLISPCLALESGRRVWPPAGCRSSRGRAVGALRVLTLARESAAISRGVSNLLARRPAQIGLDVDANYRARRRPPRGHTHFLGECMFAQNQYSKLESGKIPKNRIRRALIVILGVLATPDARIYGGNPPFLARPQLSESSVALYAHACPRSPLSRTAPCSHAARQH